MSLPQRHLQPPLNTQLHTVMCKNLHPETNAQKNVNLGVKQGASFPGATYSLDAKNAFIPSMASIFGTHC